MLDDLAGTVVGILCTAISVGGILSPRFRVSSLIRSRVHESVSSHA